MKGNFTKAKQISRKTKEAVWERQGGRSLFSRHAITVDECCCHFIGRGRSGVGYEWNIFGCTPEEHSLFDQNKDIKFNGRTVTIENARTIVRNHLILHYRGWSEKKCHYIKYADEEEYGVERYDKY